MNQKMKILNYRLHNAEIIDSNAVEKNEVSLGKSVTFKELPDEEPETYTIVGAAESDPLSGKISNDSPIARSLIGHKVGEEVEIDIPAGKIKVKIIKVENA